MKIDTGTTQQIEVGEHIYQTPPIPEPKQILFYSNQKEDQYWNRKELLKSYPDYFFKWRDEVEIDTDFTKYEGDELISISREDTKELIRLRDQEFQRMREGVWFMNNGQPTYITGNHYGALMWGAMKGSKNEVEERSIYGQYLRLQRDYCYFIDIIKNTKVARGGTVVKPKKTGITQLQSLIILIDAMLNRTSIHRIMSTKEDEAKSSCFAYIAYAIEKWPRILCPTIGKQNMGEVYFGERDPARARTKKNRRIDIEYLNSWITTVATSERSFDQLTNNTAWIDEQSKIEEASPKAIHTVTIETVKQGVRRYGYIIYTGYVSEKTEDSFEQARDIYYDSKLKTITKEGGETKSNLLCFALTVKDGLWGCCDKYGTPIIADVLRYIEDQYNSVKDDYNALQAKKRQYPFSEEDCWRDSDGDGMLFDNIRLAERKLEIEMSGGPEVMDFNFRWNIAPVVDEIKGVYKFDGIPLIVPVTEDEKMQGKEHGLFKWYHKEWTPDSFLKKWLYKVEKDARGKLKPNAATPFYAAADPTNYSLGKDVIVGSKNALQIFIMPNGEVNSLSEHAVSNKRLMVEYLHRPQKPSDFLMHTIQVLLTFGCYILIESNMSWLATRLKEWGFENFLIVLNEDNILEPYKPYAKQRLFTSQKDTIGQYTSAGVQHLGGIDTVYGIDNIKYIESIEVIKQLMKFDPLNTREFDAAVCYLLGQLGMDHHMGWYRKHMEKMNAIGDGTISTVLYGLLG